MTGFFVFVAIVVALAALQRVRELNKRLDALEMEVSELRGSLPIASAPARAPAAPPRPAVTPAVAAASRQPVAPPAPVAPAPPSPPPGGVMPPPEAIRLPAAAPPPLPRPTAPSPAAALPGAPPPAASPAMAAPGPAVAAPAAPPGTAARAPVPAEARAMHAPTDVEEVLGAQLFLKVGVATLVVGVVLFLGYAFRMMGPAGRVAVGYLAGAGLLAGGLVAERRETYRAFGRALVAGGWGILYFVTFATHFVPAARVVESAAVTIVALLVVAAAAVAFSLRYRHEWTTCASFLLIYLALFIAAVQLDVAFNLAATVIVGVSLAVLAWWLGWERMLALGVPATWAVAAAWLVPRLLAQPEAAATGASLAVLAALFAIWAALQTAVVERRAGGSTDETWPVAASLLNLVGPLLTVVYLRRAGGRGDAIAAVVFGLLYLAAAAHLRRRGRRELYLLSATVGIIALLAAPPLYFGIASRWLSVFWLIELELVLVAGVLLREPYIRGLAHGGFIAVAVDLALVRVAPGVLAPGAAPNAVRLPLLAGASALALANTFLLRRPWRAAFGEDEIPDIAYLYSGMGSVLLALLLWWQVPDLWIAPVLAGVALAWIAAALWLGMRDFLWQGSGFVVLAVAAAAAKHLPVAPEELPIATRVWPLVLAALGLYAAALLLRLNPGDGTFVERSKLRRFAGLASAAGALFVLALVERAVPDLWQAAACTAFATLCFLVVRWRPWADVLVEGVLMSLVGLVYLVGTSWRLDGEVVGLPARTVSVLAAVAFLYVAHGLLRARALAAQRSQAKDVGGIGAEDVGGLAGAYLVASTLAVAWLVKAEALAHGKNALVALLWGFLGVAYLELGRLWRSRAWYVLGHALLAAGAVHLFLVNFEQPGWVGPASVRLLTVLPFLAMIVYVHLTSRAAAEAVGVEQPEWAPVPYLYLTVAVVATLLLYELPRSWVVVAWTVTAVATLLLWRWRADPHWRLAATILAAAAVVRGVGSNLTVRDVIEGERVNLVTLPLACLLLLAGYLIVRRSESRTGTTLDAIRVAWLLATVILLTATIAVEADGTVMTVWLGAEGLAVVTLGIAARDRLARLLGLALLTFCILKLFLYDLRGLTGLARIFSFIVLGAILIAVSYAYTRFRERLKEVL
jgi:hypothetical protein